MRLRRRRQLSVREAALLGLVVVTVASILGALIAADLRLSAVSGQGGEFLSIWVGARAFVLDSGSPYSVNVASAAQHLAYGAPAVPGQNPLRVTLPFFLYPVFFPFALVSSPVVARGIWLFLMQGALAATALIYFSLVDWRPPRTAAVLLAAGALFALYSVISLLTGSLVVLLGFLYAGILWAIRSQHDELAGLFLCLALFKWEVGLLIVPLVLFRVVHEKRWGVFAGFMMPLVILAIVSFLLYPGWTLPFLTSTVGDLRASYGLTTRWIIGSLLPGTGIFGWRILAAVLVVLLVYEWWSSRGQSSRRFVWLSMLTLAVTPLLGFRTELANLVVLAPCSIVVCSAARTRSPRATGLGVFMAIAVFGVPWLLIEALNSLGPDRTLSYLFLFYPLATIAALYWTRWWFARTPRTWLDEVRAAGG